MSAPLRRAALKKAVLEPYDLVVIGGGITGAGIARDATLRGLRTILLEKRDFAWGTSSRSGKLVHGGLRYLRQNNFKLVFESTNERYRLRKTLAPHIVKPVKFVIPYYRSSRTPRWFVTIGLFLYGALSLFRNAGRFHMVTPEQLEADEPDLRRHGSVGALAYYDSQALDFRLVIDTLKDAAAHGATLLNYAEVQKIERTDKGHCVHVADRLGADTFRVQAEVVINASGAWADEVQARSESPQRFSLAATRGVHIVLPRSRLDIRHALALESPQDNRNVYVVPWGAMALVGTTDTSFKGNLDDVRVDRADTDYLLHSINHYFPRARLTTNDIHSSYAGVRPLVGGTDEKAEAAISRDHHIHMDDSGMVAIAGGKLTTYRAMSEHLLNRVAKRFFKHRQLKRCSTISPISGGDLESVDMLALEGRCADLPMGLGELLLHRYGENVNLVLDCVESTDDGAVELPGGVDLVYGEIDYFAQVEFACTVDDVLSRRSTASIFSPDRGMLAAEAVAQRLGEYLGWETTEIAAQITAYHDTLRP